jgi:hypothetical protein
VPRSLCSPPPAALSQLLRWDRVPGGSGDLTRHAETRCGARMAGAVRQEVFRRAHSAPRVVTMCCARRPSTPVNPDLRSPLRKNKSARGPTICGRRSSSALDGAFWRLRCECTLEPEACGILDFPTFTIWTLAQATRMRPPQSLMLDAKLQPSTTGDNTHRTSTFGPPPTTSVPKRMLRDFSDLDYFPLSHDFPTDRH